MTNTITVSASGVDGTGNPYKIEYELSGLSPDITQEELAAKEAALKRIIQADLEIAMRTNSLAIFDIITSGSRNGITPKKERSVEILLNSETDKDIDKVVVGCGTLDMQATTIRNSDGQRSLIIKNNELPIGSTGIHRIVVKGFNAKGEHIRTTFYKMRVDGDNQITDLHKLV